MKISIIIPTYNRPNLLSRALESVFAQKGDFEIVVIDDASTPETKKVVDLYLQKSPVPMFYIQQETNRGVNAARNRGIKEAGGEWIFCLDDDDELLSGAIASVSEKIDTLPLNIDVMYFNSIIYNGTTCVDGGFQFTEGALLYDPTYEDTMTKFGLKGDCKPVFRKSLFKNPRYLFPETLNGFESYTMSLLARDKKGIRYFKEKSTRIHFNPKGNHLSNTAPRKNPIPLFKIHCKQLGEHASFYLTHPIFSLKKIKVMLKLLIRVFLR
ncbi:MAG: glycosyltransferase family 2 protein [Candidatus Zambryskibacteria bacterium]|nr:glycosyltransferase family 2 protein [Candidatus Zambryskibacteria bacterium]